MTEKQRVKEVVDALLTEEYIMELYEYDKEFAEEMLYELIHNTGFNLDEAKDYFTAIHNK